MMPWRRYISHLRSRGNISKGNDARAAGDWARAAAAYRLALEVSPDLWPIWVQYGHMLKESGDAEAASHAYNRALALEPGAADTHLQVGHLRKLQSDLDAAVASYARALELDPEMADAIRELLALGRADLVNRLRGNRLKASPHPTVEQRGAIESSRIDVVDAKVDALASQIPTFLEHVSNTKALSFQVADSRVAIVRHSDELKSLQDSVDNIRANLVNRDNVAASDSRASTERIELIGERVQGIALRSEVIAAELAGFLEQLSVANALASELATIRGVVGDGQARLSGLERDLERRSNTYAEQIELLDQDRLKTRAKLDNIEDYSQDLAAQVADNARETGRNANAMATQSVRLEAVDGRLADHTNKLNTQTARLEAIGERTVEHSGKMERYAAAVSTQAGKVGAFESQIAAQATTLNGLLKDVGSQSGRLESSEGRLSTQAAVLGTLLERSAAQVGKLEGLERRVTESNAAISATVERINAQLELFGSVEGRVAKVADGLEAYRATSTRNASEFTAFRLTENERYTELRKDLDQYIADSGETHQYILGRVEFVRREVLYEFKYGSRKTKPGAALSVKSKVINEERYAEAIKSGRVVLNVGCGHIVQPDCLNVDRRELPGIDVIAEADKLPFERGTVNEIRSSHLLEHFPEEALVRGLLPYWHGLLKPGGRIRAIVPDGDAMLSEYAAGRYPFDDLREVLYGSQDYDGDFHFNLLTPSSLRSILETSGFKQVELIESGRRNGRCFEFEMEAIA
jgi:hypothetical protein